MSAVAMETEVSVVVSYPPSKRALFLLDAWPSFEQQQPMARALQDAGWQCWFMPLVGAQLTEEAEQMVRLWPLLSSAKSTGSASGRPRVPQKPTGTLVKRLRSLVRRTIRTGGMSAARQFLFAVRMTREWRYYRALARARIELLNPDCVITAQDRIQSTLPVVAAARDLGIPIILAVCAELSCQTAAHICARTIPTSDWIPGLARAGSSSG